VHEVTGWHTGGTDRARKGPGQAAEGSAIMAVPISRKPILA